MNHFVFVGERRSNTARRMGVTWRDGRLAAKPLFEALTACQLSPDAQTLCNLFSDRGGDQPLPLVLRTLREQSEAGITIVAMGRKVQAALAAAGVTFVPMVHPAARGRIRRRDRYINHVKEVLCGHQPEGDLSREPTRDQAKRQARRSRPSDHGQARQVQYLLRPRGLLRRAG